MKGGNYYGANVSRANFFVYWHNWNAINVRNGFEFRLIY